MYDSIGEFIKIVKANKKCLIFNHESRPHIEYFTNQSEQEGEALLEWEFCIIDKTWLALKVVKKYRIWKKRRQDFALTLEVIV